MPTYGDDVSLLNGTATGAGVQWPGGSGRFAAVCSNWNGATATLQFQFAAPAGDGSWVNADAPGVTYTTLSANGAGRFTLPPCMLRVQISGAVPAANVLAAATVTRG